MAERILKWTLPVDEHAHPIGGGQVVHVGCQGGNHRAVQVWTLEDDAGHEVVAAQVFGTGQPLPEGARPIGSVVVDPLVWHVCVVTSASAPPWRIR